MPRTLLMLLACATLLGGCARMGMHDQHHAQYRDKHHADPLNPQVTVDGSTITVEPAILTFDSRRGRQVITWRLDPKSGYRFAPRGIEFDGRLVDRTLPGPTPGVALDVKQTELGGCQLHDASGLAVSCSNTGARGIYKYTIRLVGGPRELPPFDPYVVNW